MHDAVVVGVLERRANLDADVDDLVPREPPAGAQCVLQAGTFHQVHDEIGRPLFLAIPLQRNDVLVPQPLQRFHFSQKTLAKAGIDCQRFRQDLDGRRDAGLLMHARVHRPHPTTAQQPLDAIRTQMFDWHGFRLP
jgi:hypothetical protein